MRIGKLTFSYFYAVVFLSVSFFLKLDIKERVANRPNIPQNIAKYKSFFDEFFSFSS